MCTPLWVCTLAFTLASTLVCTLVFTLPDTIGNKFSSTIHMDRFGTLHYWTEDVLDKKRWQWMINSRLQFPHLYTPEPTVSPRNTPASHISTQPCLFVAQLVRAQDQKGQGLGVQLPMKEPTTSEKGGKHHPKGGSTHCFWKLHKEWEPLQKEVSVFGQAMHESLCPWLFVHRAPVRGAL